MKGWRNDIPIHPVADLFPLLGETDLAALGDNIDKNGLTSPIAIALIKNKPVLLDGRNRLDAMEKAGLQVTLERNNTGTWKLLAQERLDDGRWVSKPITGYAGATVIVVTGDPTEYIVSVNIHRRHLTPETKRELIAALIKSNPEKSDRQIAKMVDVSPTTVGDERKKTCPELDTSIDTKGRRQPRRKPKPTKPKAEPNVEPTVMTDATEVVTGAEPEVVTEVITAPPTAPAQPEQPVSPGPDWPELSLNDIVQIVVDQVAAGKISRSALGTAIRKLQQIKLTIIPAKKQTDHGGRGHRDARDRAKAVWREDPSLTKRAVQDRANCGSKAALEARRELEEAGEIAPKKAKRTDKAKAMPNPFIPVQ